MRFSTRSPKRQLGRLRRSWPTALIFFALVIGSFAFSTWVGFHDRSQEGDFNWELFAIVGTALGTSLLAFATGILALETRADVQASSDIAQIAREDQDARSRPIVLIERVDITVVTGGDAEVAIVLRNAGLGVAVRGLLELRYVEGVTRLVEKAVYTTSLISGETKTFGTSATPSQSIASRWRRVDWSVSGVFLDAAGKPHSLIDGQPAEPAERVAVTDPPVGLDF